MIRPLEPHKNENPLAGGFPSATAKKHETNVNATDAERKRFETLRAKFALVGHAFYETTSADGRSFFIATRYGLCRELTSLEAATAFLLQIGGAR
jgi:hypothetical protein